jgi:glycosyltransferase involved in cell wall biosynthesis
VNSTLKPLHAYARAEKQLLQSEISINGAEARSRHKASHHEVPGVLRALQNMSKKRTNSVEVASETTLKGAALHRLDSRLVKQDKALERNLAPKHLFVVNNFNDDTEGLYLLKLFENIASVNTKQNLYLFSFGAMESLADEFISSYNVTGFFKDNQKKSGFGRFLQLIYCIRSINPDRISCFGFKGSLLSSLALKTALRKSRVFWHLYDAIEGEHERLTVKKEWMLKFFEKCSLCPTKLISHFKSAQEQLKEIGYSDSKNILLTPVTAKHSTLNILEIQPQQDFKRLSSDVSFKNSKLDLRRALGLEQEDFVVGSFADFHSGYDIQTLCKALSTLVGKTKKLQILIAGSGINDSNTNLLQLLKQCGIQKYVHFLEFSSSVLQYIKACDVIVSSSLYTTPVPQYIVESMAVGVPIVVADSISHKELIGNGGIFFKKKDPFELFNALMKVYSYGPLMKEEISRKLRNKVHSSFSEQCFARKYQALFEEC